MTVSIEIFSLSWLLCGHGGHTLSFLEIGMISACEIIPEVRRLRRVLMVLMR